MSGAKRNKKVCVTGDGSENDTGSTSASSTPKKGGKETRKRKIDDNICKNITKQESATQAKNFKPTQDNSKDLELCRYQTYNTHGQHISYCIYGYNYI